MFRSFLSRAVKLVSLTKPSIESLIDTESKIGGQLFGHMSRGVTRRFFLDDGNSWFYSEKAIDTSSGRELYSFTIRYEVLPQGVLKSVDGRGHVFITGIELLHLKQAIKLYKQRIKDEIYTPQQPKSVRALGL